jgi:phenylpropionate dioxygenase-like ring-hydroxylating dioxygenase large terminal subunit
MSVARIKDAELVEGLGADAPWHPTGDGLPTYQEVISQDRVPPPADSPLRQVAFEYLGSEDIPKERYFAQDYFQKEIDHVWKKTWQPVCHESQLLNVGDVFVYNVAGMSALVTRVSATQIKAFHNSCLHRGTEFRLSSGTVKQFRCPFHGFTWKLDGTFDSLPTEWDFLHIDKEAFSLAELQVDTWAGFVFVNPDLSAPGLDEYLGEIVDHFRPWKVENRVVMSRVTKPIRANWKVCSEAFLETIHVITVHPQLLPRAGDSNAQHDIFWPHFNRMISPVNVPSPQLALSGRLVSEQEIVDRVVSEDFVGVMGEGSELPSMLGEELAELFKDGVPKEMFQVPPGGTARSFLAEFTRAQVQALRGDNGSETLSDAEVSDAIGYAVFPNFHILGGYGYGLTFWFRPLDENDPERCLLELYISRPGSGAATENNEKAPHYELSEEDSFSDIKELAGVSLLFDQDTRNMLRVQRGLRHSAKAGVTLANYGEVRIRHFHALLDEYMGIRSRQSPPGED